MENELLVQKDDLITYLNNVPRGLQISVASLQNKFNKAISKDDILSLEPILNAKGKHISINGELIQIFPINKKDTFNAYPGSKKTSDTYHEETLDHYSLFQKNRLENYRDSDFYKIASMEEDGKIENYSVFSLFSYSDLNKPICNGNKKHDLEDVNFTTNTVNGYNVSLKIKHCKTCGKFIIDSSSLGNFRTNITDNLLLPLRSDSGYKWRTDLTNHGYNVKQNDLSERDRRKILYTLIRSGEMDKEEILNQLKNFVSQYKSNPSFKDAINKWEKDMEYLEHLDVIVYPQIYQIRYLQ